MVILVDMEENHNTNIDNQEDSEPTGNSVQQPVAPAMGQLLKDGWEFTKLRTDLLKWYVLVLAVVGVLSSEYVLEMGGIISFSATIALFVTLVFLAMNTWAIIYVVSQPDDAQVSYKDAFAWSSGNFFPLLWTSILSGLAVLGGMLLLIIPGIALSIYLYFTTYAAAMGSGFGVPALKQSHRDVKGRWWPVTIKLFTLSLWLMLLYLIPIVVYALIFALAEESKLSFLVADVLIQGVFGGVVGIMTMYAVAKYYNFLRSTKAQDKVFDKKSNT